MGDSDEQTIIKNRLLELTDLFKKKKRMAEELKQVNEDIKNNQGPLIEYLIETDNPGYSVKIEVTDNDGSVQSGKAQLKLKRKPRQKIPVNKKHVEARLNSFLQDAKTAQAATEHIYADLEKDPDADDEYSLEYKEVKEKRQKLLVDDI